MMQAKSSAAILERRRPKQSRPSPKLGEKGKKMGNKIPTIDDGCRVGRVAEYSMFPSSASVLGCKEKTVPGRRVHRLDRPRLCRTICAKFFFIF
jgi:hypothetical protein